jgi:hypothetical protein
MRAKAWACCGWSNLCVQRMFHGLQNVQYRQRGGAIHAALVQQRRQVLMAGDALVGMISPAPRSGGAAQEFPGHGSLPALQSIGA